MFARAHEGRFADRRPGRFRKILETLDAKSRHRPLRRDGTHCPRAATASVSARALGDPARRWTEQEFFLEGPKASRTIEPSGARSRMEPIASIRSFPRESPSRRASAQLRPLRPRPAMIASRRLRRSASKIPYVESLATTIRAICGLSRQTPAARITKSAGSKTWPLMKSSTVRSTFGRSGSIKSNMNFDEPSLPSCMMPMVGSYPSEMALIRISLSSAA
jgi:hypothetical protein